MSTLVLTARRRRRSTLVASHVVLLASLSMQQALAQAGGTEQSGETSPPASAAPPANTAPTPPAAAPPAAAPLPTVSVQAPQSARRAQVAQRARQVAPRRVPQPVPAEAPPTAAANTQPAAETGIGPVRGYVAKRSVTATKTDTPILETPQSISVVTQDQIAAQEAQTLPQALRYVPGVITEPYGASSLSSDIKVRGFLAPRYLDGLRLPVDSIITFAPPRIDPWAWSGSRC